MPHHRHIPHNPPEDCLRLQGHVCTSLLASVVAAVRAPLMHWEATRLFTRKWNHEKIAVEVVVDRENKSQMSAKVVKEQTQASCRKKNCLHKDGTDRWREAKARVRVTLEREKNRGAAWQLPSSPEAWWCFLHLPSWRLPCILSINAPQGKHAIPTTPSVHTSAC